MCLDDHCDEVYGKTADGSCTRCSTLVYTACSMCTDVATINGTVMQSECLECAAGYTLADDNSACLCK